MKNMLPISFILLIFTYSCSENKAESTQKEFKKTHIFSKTDQVKANKMLNANIDGMVCEKGCGSSIRKELMNTNAVESCEFDFQTDRKINTVKIAFDQEKISVNKLLSIIKTMNEKQFKVIDSSTSDIESKAAVNESKIKEVEVKNEGGSEMKDEVHILPKTIEQESTGGSSSDTPNLLQIFSRLITG